MALRSSRLGADLVLGIVSFIWGSTFVVVKDALAEASPLVFLTLRFALATAVLALLLWRRENFYQAGILRAGFLIGFFLAAGFTFQTVGLQYTTPAKSAFITGLSVAIVPVLLTVFFGRRIRGWTAAGVATAVAGLYLLTVPPDQWAVNRGDLLTVFCAFAYAAHIIAVGHFAPRYSSTALGFAQIGAVLILTGLALPTAHATQLEPMRVVWSAKLALAVGITGVLATALAFSAQAWAQQRTSPTHTAILFSLEPVFAGLTSYLVHGEQLTGRALAGAALILAGILVVEFKGPAPTAAELPVSGPPGTRASHS
ncbi:MAG: DMT family transporter [Acidobacteria bacterium]|nr:DMT family transporter [Acidobacteriota bacterium]